MNRDEHPVEGLSAYLDGALASEERREVEAHLAECPSCARLLEDLRTLSDDLRTEGIPEVPERLEASVLRAMGGGAARGVVVPFRRSWTIPAGIAATLGAAALMVVAYRFLPMRSTTPLAVPAESPVETPATDERGEVDRAEKVEKKQRSVLEEGRRDIAVSEPEPTPPPSSEGPAADSVAALAPAGAAREGKGGRFLSRTLMMEVGSECRDAFRPYDRGLRHVGPTPEETIEAADRYVRALGGTIVRVEGAPFERDYQVRATAWEGLRDFLRREGYTSDEEPRPVPPEADCVGVRVDAFPESP